MAFTDDDETGERLADRIDQKLGKSIPVRRVDYAPYRAAYEEKLDPGEMTRSDIAKILLEARFSSSWPTF